jgi:hypothetical protein
MTTRSFKYQERSKEDWRERANMKGGQMFDSIIKPSYKLYKIKDGKNVIRIMPPTWERSRHYAYDIFVNYDIGPDNGSYLSLSKMKGERDPIAEARLQADREDDAALAKALRPTQRELMWIIDRVEEDEGPLLFNCPFTVDQSFINLAYDQDTGAILRIDHPEDGCDIRFYKEGKGKEGTKYDASKMRLMEPGPLCDDEKKQQEWLNYITEHPVPDCLQFYSYDHILKVFGGGAPVAKDEEPEPAPRKAAKPVEPDPEEEEEKLISDPEPAPRRARPRVAESEETADPGPKSGSIRDRIRRRHQTASQPAEED